MYALVLVVFALAAMAFLWRQNGAKFRAPVYRERVFAKGADTSSFAYPTPDAAPVAEFATAPHAAASAAWHLSNSTAAHGTHALIGRDGRTSLDGRSSFKELGGSTDDRVARVQGSLQRRHARTMTKATTANAMSQFTPWVEPGLTKEERRDWWGEENVFVERN